MRIIDSMTNLKNLAIRLQKRTGNYQDAEDAIQDAALHLIKYSGDMKHLLNQAYHEAADNFTRYRSYQKGRGLTSAYTPDIDSVIEAKQRLKAITTAQRPRAQNLLNILLKADVDISEAAQNSGYSMSSFKSLIFNLQKVYKI